MDVLTKDGVVIEIGAAITEVNDQQRYIINDRVYAGGSYRLHQNVDVPEFVKAGAYMYDGTGFAKYSGYFMHDNTSEESQPDELYRAVNLLNQAEIIANQRQQDKVMAAILLEQVGGEVNV